MFDSHCHLDDPGFDGQLPRLLADGRKQGVTGWFVPGVSRSRQSAICALGERYDGVCYGLGVHPWHAEELAADGASVLTVLGDQVRGARAIGECGLDAPHAKGAGVSLERQVTIFEAQLGLARDLNLPVVLHIVGAHGRALKILRTFAPFEHGGVLHAYCGSAEMVRDYAALGLSFGFGLQLTRSGARRARAALMVVSADRLLLETDLPQPSSSSRGEGELRPQEPGRALQQVLKEAVVLRHESAETIARQTTENARRLYGV